MSWGRHAVRQRGQKIVKIFTFSTSRNYSNKNDLLSSFTMMNYSFCWSLLLLALTPQVSAFSGSSTTPSRPSFMTSSRSRRSIQQQSRLTVTSFTELSMSSLASASLSYEMFENAAKAQSQSLRCTEETEFLDDETEVRNGLFPLHNQDDNYTEEGCFE
jgi:hypothetical protein